ncbi:MAG TPA: serine/threonine-protein kinase [Vicinamibacterales bacterium]|nr:serine/threonine-protein kinase [Vicinamibacterales bacterium]
MSSLPLDSDAATHGSLTPERFARVRAIFEAALEQPTRDRQGFVEGACVGDAVLLREVEAMLAADATGAPLLDRPASTPSSSAPEGRFPAGTVLAGRYRILGRLGQGGMGEVYRAHDLILNQTVALKFLAPAHLSEAALARFRNEVRIARQVSHPNVCRVYDLGMVEGLHFLSMEYIDGEDLASLLRRIGRLPQDKAIEFTRKICAGLGAAHERGVLHRDLKPANIMIDGRGQPRITDFGLAGLAAEIPLSDLRSGTPAYMSPEQKAGKDVTIRSDLYSLGLVLHEMFTGKARRETQSSPSELVKDLDPAIERLIVRCLEEDPKRRPSTALNVVMALPGADPIAAALAAGETPSPEMVAASQEKEGLSPRAAVACVTLVAISLAACLFLAPRTTLPGVAPLRVPPDGLAFKAQDMLRQFGYSEAPRATAYGFSCCASYFPDFLDGYEPSRRTAVLASHQPPVSYFWYRQHRTDLLPNQFFPADGKTATVTMDSPANSEPGMIRVVLDPNGRLVRLDVRPWLGAGTDGSGSAADIKPDWTALFVAAGLDSSLFTPVEPREIPPMAFDTGLAWTGRYSADRPEEVRVEAAFWRGQPVFLEVGRLGSAPQSVRAGANGFVTLVFVLVVLVGSLLAAARNLRLGRVDRSAAAKFGVAGFAIVTAKWVIEARHIAGPWETAMLVTALSWALFVGGALWVLYIAIEPQVRRHWPDSLISWTRFQGGHIRNPLVASHLLAGIAAAEAFDWLVHYPLRLWISAPPDSALFLGGVSSFAEFVTGRLNAGVTSIFGGMGFVLLVVLFRLAVRKLWLADTLACVALSLLGLGYFGNDLYRQIASVVFFTGAGALWLWLFRRFGLLSFLTALVILLAGRASPLILDTWFSRWTLAAQGTILAVAAWAVFVILSFNEHRNTESVA